ncbi:hypothetical protein CSA56_06130 [candidate division KSB3 bacterium]|uniref:Uncharacterized protein n=1 Tax=candidate division KSB3 bacterium TaxID=2044937 RepID=A0A2G6KH59_9BACT|nr:MAG: hypothetical protein CSA56_06130 [candidate division KSB3 bacterium]
MKTLLKSVVICACLAMLAVPALAGIESSGFSPAGIVPSGMYHSSPWGCGAIAPSKYPGSTEYCSKWIPGHWVQVQVMRPGYWSYRPVWIPPQPMTQNRWVKGFWQTTGTNIRPDVYVWRFPNGRYYGIPHGMKYGPQNGFFSPQGVWTPYSQK